MAKKKATKRNSRPITNERAGRLLRLINLIGRKKQSRDFLVGKLKIGVRDFYRDLDVLRDLGVNISLVGGNYSLSTSLTEARGLIPLTITMTLADAEALSKGRSEAHRKLAKIVRDFKSSATRGK